MIEPITSHSATARRSTDSATIGTNVSAVARCWSYKTERWHCKQTVRSISEFGVRSITNRALLSPESRSWREIDETWWNPHRLLYAYHMENCALRPKRGQ
jgi:hypothetical protein